MWPEGINGRMLDHQSQQTYPSPKADILFSVFSAFSPVYLFWTLTTIGSTGNFPLGILSEYNLLFDFRGFLAYVLSVHPK